MAGATPVFIDVDPDTYSMDWRQLDQALTPRTRAIMPVHLYGHPADMQPVLDFARVHGLRVIEDASQAHGATYRGQRVGGLGDIGCFSFYFSKNLGAYGEAGMCTTNDAQTCRNRCASCAITVRSSAISMRFLGSMLAWTNCRRPYFG